MRIFLSLVVVAWSCNATIIYDIEDAKNLFEEFIREYSKVYKSENEKQMRLNVFKETLKTINTRNSAQDGSEHRINKFADITDEEFSGQNNLFDIDKVTTDMLCPVIKKDVPRVGGPANFDWRNQNMVSAVKDQGDCGASYAFSAVTAMESTYAIKMDKLISSSEQQIIDCDTAQKGCNGGLMSLAMKHIIDIGGIRPEKEYPYTQKQGHCTLHSLPRVFVHSCETYNLTSSNKVVQLLSAYGPIAIGIKSTALKTYHGGIISAQACDIGHINYGANLVGYGTENGKDFFTVRTSWGENFGEKGYFRMERAEGLNTCGFLNLAMTRAVV